MTPSPCADKWWKGRGGSAVIVFAAGTILILVAVGIFGDDSLLGSLGLQAVAESKDGSVIVQSEAISNEVAIFRDMETDATTKPAFEPSLAPFRSSSPTLVYGKRTTIQPTSTPMTIRTNSPTTPMPTILLTGRPTAIVNATKLQLTKSPMPPPRTKAPTIPFPLDRADPLPNKKPLRRFVCLNESEEAWEARKRFAANLTTASCNATNVLGPHRRKNSTIPVFFILTTPRYMAGKKPMTVLTVSTAARMNEQVTLIVIGKDEWRLKDDPTLVKHRVRVLVAENGTVPHPVFTAFWSFNQTTYVHKSPNKFTYEMFCFQRWFALAQIAEMENIDVMFAADTDMLLLSNVTLDYDHCYNGCRWGGASLVATFASFFSKEVLMNFAKYIRYMYTSKRYLILAKSPHPVSDMTVLDDFYKQTVPSAIECFDTTTFRDRVNRWYDARPLSAIDFVNFYQWLNDFYQDEQTQMPYLYRHPKDYPRKLHIRALHFQGEGKKYLWECERSFTSSARRLDEKPRAFELEGRIHSWLDPTDTMRRHDEEY